MPDQLHRFLFDGLPVRGSIVRLTDAWTEILQRRQDSTSADRWPPEVAGLLGQMAAAGVLMQSSIKFEGALILQMYGEGPVKMAVAEVQHDLGLRATAKVMGPVAPGAGLADLLNTHGGGRCAITLDARGRRQGQQPYQGVVPLNDAHGQRLDSLAAVLEQYMRQSEQVETRLVLAADAQSAAGLLIQRLPTEGDVNRAAIGAAGDAGQEAGQSEDSQAAFEHIATLAASLRADELLSLELDTVLHRLFWQEKLLRFEPQAPRFACSCSRERVAGMIRGLGRQEAESILAERDEIDVACEFCARHYRFDAVDATRIFTSHGNLPPASTSMQ